MLRSGMEEGATQSDLIVTDGHERWAGSSEGSVEGEIDQNQKSMGQHVHEVTADTESPSWMSLFHSGLASFQPLLAFLQARRSFRLVS